MRKTILVTGASSGIGYALAEALQKEGHTVIGVSRTYPKNAFAWEHLCFDMAVETSITALHEAIKEKYPHLDVLINCAGYGIGGAIERTEPIDAENIHRVNVLGPYMTIRTFLPLLREAPRPKIINIGSVAGDITIPFQAFYSMTKASLSSLTEALRMELKPFGVDVSIVLPGDTKTAFTEHRLRPLKNDPLYGDRIVRSLDKMAKDEQHGMPVSSVVKVVKKQLKKRRMKARVAVGLSYKTFLVLNRILPHCIKERLIYRSYGR